MERNELRLYSRNTAAFCLQMRQKTATLNSIKRTNRPLLLCPPGLERDILECCVAQVQVTSSFLNLKIGLVLFVKLNNYSKTLRKYQNGKFKSNHLKVIYIYTHYILYIDITVKTYEGNPVLGQVVWNPCISV